MSHLFKLLFLLLLTALGAAPAHAQRYLSEFVGTSRVTVGREIVPLDVNMQFDASQGVRLGGSFSFVETSPRTLQTEVETYASGALLLADGSCPTRVWQTGSSGFLRLVEHSFDVNSFALVGTLDLSADPGAVRLTSGRLAGPMAYLNPPADALAFPWTFGDLGLVGATSSRSYDVTLEAQDVTGTARGLLADARGAVPWDVMVAANGVWFYLVGVGDGSFLVARGAVQLDARGTPIGATGRYDEVTAANKVIDTGTFDVALF